MTEAVLFCSTFTLFAALAWWKRAGVIVTLGGGVIVACVALMVGVSLRPKLPIVHRDPVDMAAIAQAVASSQDVETYRAAFTAGAAELVASGACSPFDIEQYGGWMRSTSHKPDPVYFLYCKGSQVRNRHYLHAASVRLFQQP